MNTSVLRVAGFLALAVSFVPQPTVAAPLAQNEWFAEFGAYIEKNREMYNVPGVAVVVVQGDEVVYAQGFGVKEAGGTDPVTPDTLFSVGSLTKAMTSMMTATLVDEGLIDWGTPVADVMPQFQLSAADATGKITLKHLFAHTTGLPNIDLMLFVAGLSPEGLVEFLGSVPLNSQPGESYTYQNQAYAIGGYVAAMAAGGEYGANLLATYIDLMQRRVFDPIGMSTATFSAAEAEAAPNHATPHYISLNGTLAQTGFDVATTRYLDIGGSASAYGLRASAMDVGRFLMIMLGKGVAPDGTRIVSSANLAETWTRQIEVTAEPYLDSASSTMGWRLEEYQGITVVTKPGGIGGFSTQMAFVPDADTGIVVFTNLDTMGLFLANNVQYRLVEMLYGLEPKVEEFAEAQLEQLSGFSDSYAQLLPVDPDSVVPYLGKYESLAGHPYSVEWRDGKLWWGQGSLDSAQLLASPKGGFVAISPKVAFFLPLDFVEGEDGSITMVIGGEIEAPRIE
jgi:CubicO group peptidase (beta-lactamase class C family)